MKKIMALVLNAVVLSLWFQHTWVQAQPLELVTLSDKGGLLPPPDKNAKEEPVKSSAAKTLSGAKRVAPSMGAEGHVARSKANSNPSASDSASSTYVIKPGDTLDKVIAMYFADSIVKTEVLRKEVMAMNPGAFSKGNPKMLLSGVTLKLPEPAQLLSKSSKPMGTTWSGEKANLTLSGYTTYPPVYVNVESSEKRRHWVQYP